MNTAVLPLLLWQKEDFLSRGSASPQTDFNVCQKKLKLSVLQGDQHNHLLSWLLPHSTRSSWFYRPGQKQWLFLCCYHFKLRCLFELLHNKLYVWIIWQSESSIWVLSHQVEEDHAGFAHVDKFLPAMTKALLENKWDSDSFCCIEAT